MKINLWFETGTKKFPYGQIDACDAEIRLDELLSMTFGKQYGGNFVAATFVCQDGTKLTFSIDNEIVSENNNNPVELLENANA